MSSAQIASSVNTDIQDPNAILAWYDSVEYKDILQWISPSVVEEDQINNFEKREDDTVKWFLELDEFKRWRDTSSQAIGPNEDGSVSVNPILWGHGLRKSLLLHCQSSTTFECASTIPPREQFWFLRTTCLSSSYTAYNSGLLRLPRNPTNYMYYSRRWEDHNNVLNLIVSGFYRMIC